MLNAWRSTLIKRARNARLQSTTTIPDAARVVIVGGGIIGTSIAYHLAHAGIKDVVLLERDKLTSGTTWHAAGLIATFGSLSESSTEIRKYSKELYANLEKETGLSTGFSPVGFIELASNSDRLEEYRRVTAFNRKFGVDVKEISPEEVKSLFPMAKTDDLLAGFYVESDGRVNPVDVTMSLAKGARMQGATLLEGHSVDKVLTTSCGKVSGVETSDGHVIKAEYVVNCAGMWARQLAAKNGVICPNQAAEHYYLVTDKMEGVDPNWPVIEDPENYAYIRPEGGGLMVGLFEGKGAAWNPQAIPNNFSFGEIEPDYDRLAPYLERAMSRVPATLEVGAKKFFCGPESFTPDNGPIIGEAPEIKNYFIAAGLNSIGILTGGGIGRLMAHWIKHGHPDMDITHMYPDRFRPYHSTPQFRTDRTSECLANVYAAHYPHKPQKTGRGVKRTPLYERLDAKKAVFRDVSGWECADFFASDEESRSQGHLPLSWGKHAWFGNWKAEHEACRNGAALFDMSFMSKWLVQGPEAGRLLDYLSTSRVDDGVNTGAITYTQWLNKLGKLEADLTVIKLTDNDTFNGHRGFMVIATDTAHRHVETRMKRYIAGQGDEVRPGFDATVTDVTGGFAQITIQGPNSRSILQAATDHDMTDTNFPFRTAREISIGYAPVVCTRITYVGELGYELFVPTEQAVHVHDCLMAASEQTELTLTHAGLKALGSLRLEKGYRDYGHDIDNTDSLLEAGLGFTCDFEKEGGFVGMAEVLKQKELGVKQLPQRLLQVLLSDPEEHLYHGEVVYCNGKIVGDVRSASYGHSLGGAVGLVMVTSKEGEPITKAFVEKGEWEVDIAGRRVPATASIQPMFDPSNKKIKA